MADTNLLVLAREYKKLREEVKKVLSMPKGDKGDPGEKGEKGDKGDTGPQGFPGRDGKDGVNGFNGKDGRDGIDGKDGKDGLDGVGVENAYIDFDNSLVIVLTDGREVNAGFLSQETKENVVATFKQGAATINELLPPQEGNANKFLKTDGTNVSWDTLDGSDIDLASPPIIGNTTPNAATFTTLTATGQTSLGGAAGSEGLRVLADPTAVSFIQATGRAAGAGVRLGIGGTDTNVNFQVFAKGTGAVRLFTGSDNSYNAVEQARVSHTASAVNYVQVTGAATGSGVVVSAQGSDTNVSIGLRSKGTGEVALGTGGTFRAFSVTGTSGANYLQATSAATNQEPVLSAQGSDTNISMALQSKGIGGISLSTGSIGTNLVNGTSVTAITRTAAGSGYTTAPDVIISPPTTAGGVQATATVAISGGAITTFTITNAGSGYVEQPTVTFSGGGGSGAAAYATVGGTSVLRTLGALQTFNSPSGPAFGIGDRGPLTQVDYLVARGGSGSVLLQAGGSSGNIGVIYQTNGTSAHNFTTSGSQTSQFQVAHTASAVNYVQVTGAATGVRPLILFQGSDANIGANISSKGTGDILLTGGGAAFTLFKVGGGASLANYVQVQASAAGVAPILSVAGSDTNIDLALTTKGTGSVVMNTGNGTQFKVLDTFGGGTSSTYWSAYGAASQPRLRAQGSSNAWVETSGTGALVFATNGGTVQQVISHTASAVNYVQVTGAATNNDPVISVQGSDASRGVIFQVKGTGGFRFVGNSQFNAFTVSQTGTNQYNHLNVSAVQSGNTPALSSLGIDTNIDLALTPKGTGLVRFGTYTAGAPTATGYISIKAADGTTYKVLVGT